MTRNMTTKERIETIISEAVDAFPSASATELARLVRETHGLLLEHAKARTKLVALCQAEFERRRLLICGPGSGFENLPYWIRKGVALPNATLEDLKYRLRCMEKRDRANSHKKVC